MFFTKFHVMRTVKQVAAVTFATVCIFLVWKAMGAGGTDQKPAPAAPKQERPVPAISRQAPPKPAQIQQSPDTIEDMVRSLGPSGTPDQYLEAFQKIRACLEVEREKALLVGTRPTMVKTADGYAYDLGLKWASEQELEKMRNFCSTMTGRTRSDRYQLLQYAVDRHAPGAFAVYVIEGPSGDQNALQERPGDPAVVEWRAAALRRLESDIDAGYTDAIFFSLTGFVHLGKADPEVQYLSFLINNKVHSAIENGKLMYTQDFVDSYSKMLTQQQKTAAELHADRIFAEWRRRNKRK